LKLDENQNEFKGLGRFAYLKGIDYKTGSIRRTAETKG
jgi:molybdenum-dependent DNA-binding transcriptional regulator ModE